MWNQLVTAALGIWLMCTPAVLSVEGAARINTLIVAPVIASVAVIAIWPATRGVRWVNFVLGAWLMASPILFAGDRVAQFNAVISGGAIALLALRRGEIEHRFAGGWRSLFKLH